MYLQKLQQKYFLMQTPLYFVWTVFEWIKLLSTDPSVCGMTAEDYDDDSVLPIMLLGSAPPPHLYRVFYSKYTLKSRSRWINTLLHTQAHTFLYHTYHTVSTRGIISPWPFLCGHLTWFSSSPPHTSLSVSLAFSICVTLSDPAQIQIAFRLLWLNTKTTCKSINSDLPSKATHVSKWK